MGLEIVFTVFPTTPFNDPLIIVLSVLIPATLTHLTTVSIHSKQAAKWAAGIVIGVGAIAIPYILHWFSV